MASVSFRNVQKTYGGKVKVLHGINFEYEATRASTGGKGYIDVFFPGHFLIEQKTAGKIKTPKLGGLSNAEEQARDYLTGGDITDAQRPRWVVTSDFTTIQVTDLSQPLKSPNRTRTINFDDLNDHLDLALARTDLGVDRLPLWAGLVRVLQWLLILTAIGAAVWTGLIFASDYLQIPDLRVPDWRGYPVPLLLLVGAVALGILLVVADLPLLIAVAHNLTAALLLAAAWQLPRRPDNP